MSKEELEAIRNSGLFDAEWYLKTYPDVKALGMDPLEHFLWLGHKLRRRPSPKFDTRSYLEQNPDVAAAGVNALVHYVLQGQKEARQVGAAGVLGPERVRSQEFVPLLNAPPLKAKPVRVIAFYLPQFHPIPENDEWWGKGFTEWTNVEPAKPQFVGHYQPHVPIDLGYYDLRDTAVQRRQIELAKLYGIEGFCFYFYWFGGKRLLEKPLENWLNDKSLDLPFCLCWANENWSRRWDGLDKEILIAQNHSPEDDINFIKEVAPYLRDYRYIRIDGKPLLLVYRPSLLPNALETAKRWRNWCRENGIGEIFLAYTQSFENADPAIYGFDAAIEFPPNNSSPPDVTPQVTPIRADFAGKVYDWSIFPERSNKYTERKYKIFRSVCPGWDNTARRKNNGTIFINNTPQLYEYWLRNAIKDTVNYFDNVDERIIFVNAWNEWAEGAHLEPDAVNGYAYLQATRNALLERSSKSIEKIDRIEPTVAIVVHAFYTDVFQEILYLIRDLPYKYKLFVTTIRENYEIIRNFLDSSGVPFRIETFPNHGRDILPFIKIYPIVKSEGFDLVLKLHTKKSLHRKDGDIWRRELYVKLLRPDIFSSSVRAFSEDHRLGMVGPDRHFVAMTTYIGSNEERILSIGRRLGFRKEQILQQGFFAGTMFMVRTSALEPLMRLGFSDADFEPEAGQIDGTMAHAIERALALSVVVAGLRIASTDNITACAEINGRYGFA